MRATSAKVPRSLPRRLLPSTAPSRARPSVLRVLRQRPARRPTLSFPRAPPPRPGTRRRRRPLSTRVPPRVCGIGEADVHSAAPTGRRYPSASRLRSGEGHTLTKNRLFTCYFVPPRIASHRPASSESQPGQTRAYAPALRGAGLENPSLHFDTTQKGALHPQLVSQATMLGGLPARCSSTPINGGTPYGRQ